MTYRIQVVWKLYFCWWYSFSAERK